MLGPIPDEQAAGAVRLPAERLGIGFQPEAIAAIVSAAEGYPYFLQVFAMKAWDAAVGTEITADDAALGIADGRLDLDMGFYPARWDRASPAERRYMEVMSRYDGGECGTAEIAEALGSTQRGLSTVRHSLISKGLIHSTERGLVAFTVPGMSAFVQRQVGD
jgi:Holliday junction resolvasome RuvABC ATP-dependent DNA helicase subunit